MRQLTALDAQFLSGESATTAAHVAGLAVLDGAITRARLIELLRERLHLAPPLRMRLADVPFGLDRPYWTEDPDFDVADHVYESIVPSADELAAHVGRIHARRLDRSRPLWEMHLIHGLGEGRVALYTKVHHAAIDGVSGTEIMSSFLDLSPEPREVEPAPPATPTTAPDVRDMLANAVNRALSQPMASVRSLSRAVADLDAIPVLSALPGARRIARAARSMMGEKPVPDLPSLAAPRTPFNGPVSSRRSFAYGSVALADLKYVARTFGMSVNDVVMTVCASALRAWLEERGSLPGQPLVAAVPVSIRSGRTGEGRNQISAMITPLATDVADLKDRLTTVRATMNAAKRRFAVSHTTWLNDLCSALPAVLARATPAVFRLAGLVTPGVNLIVSNVPGPQVPLYMSGARLLAYYPMSVLTDMTGGLSITCLSYDGNLDFGVVACPSRVPDVWQVMDHIREAMTELVKLADADHLDHESAPEPGVTSPGALVAN
ncbi:wax ester/triacylglycerol synthase family O-acyltransferase [Acrocarpospora macrocephala]|uniref:Diacylglycerol O-acyltransferase n=1 Tax=Acrocarpospora macrocephala TaxID=150177 RepID=A0A5M3WUY0_9ACTN|nr:wax ester/triacylglycerol synthase family O-acyltransferase [Acrocarpospora macrocephala]GES11101.1 diacylglycerol O-acyltransferase [Acrocarpospora macrocephala]